MKVKNTMYVQFFNLVLLYLCKKMKQNKQTNKKTVIFFSYWTESE